MSAEQLLAHLATGNTTVCRVWTVVRRDGRVLGFTDHDGDLLVDGVVHLAASGLTARSIQSGSGLSVDNSEVVGVLSDASISEDDVVAGRFDGAKVRLRLVNWADTSVWFDVFQGSIGEIVRNGAEFTAELRGVSEPLNQAIGLTYSRGCSAVLGDSRCRFDLLQPGYSVETAVLGVDAVQTTLTFDGLNSFEDRWFSGGKLEVLTGAAAGLVGVVKSDRLIGSVREIMLWQSIRAELRPLDQVRLQAGCDKRLATCREKFTNVTNFRGFPHIPGEDWLSAYPRPGQAFGGGSLVNG